MKPPTMPQYPDLRDGPEAAMRHVVKRTRPPLTKQQWADIEAQLEADIGAALECAISANEVKR
jgi:hypothetical protein